MPLLYANTLQTDEDLCQFLAAVRLGERAPATPMGPPAAPDRRQNANDQPNDADPRNGAAQPRSDIHMHSGNHPPAHAAPIVALNPIRNPVVRLYPNVRSASVNTSIDSGSGEELASNVEAWVEAQYQQCVIRTTRLRTYSISSTGSVHSLNHRHQSPL